MDKKSSNPSLPPPVVSRTPSISTPSVQRTPKCPSLYFSAGQLSPLFSDRQTYLLALGETLVHLSVMTFLILLTADQSPGTFSAGQSILLQSRDTGSDGLLPVHLESDSVWNFPLVTSCRQTTSRVCAPLPQVLEHGRHPDTYQLDGKQKFRARHY